MTIGLKEIFIAFSRIAINSNQDSPLPSRSLALSLSLSKCLSVSLSLSLSLSLWTLSCELFMFFNSIIQHFFKKKRKKWKFKLNQFHRKSVLKMLSEILSSLMLNVRNGEVLLTLNGRRGVEVALVEVEESSVWRCNAPFLYVICCFGRFESTFYFEAQRSSFESSTFIFWSSTFIFWSSKFFI